MSPLIKNTYLAIPILLKWNHNSLLLKQIISCADMGSARAIKCACGEVFDPTAHGDKSTVESF